jgi:hypothetical protein
VKTVSDLFLPLSAQEIVGVLTMHVFNPEDKLWILTGKG